MRGGEGGDELGEGVRAGDAEIRLFWQPGRARLGRESVFRLANRADGHESAVRFFWLSLLKKNYYVFLLDLCCEGFQGFRERGDTDGVV